LCGEGAFLGVLGDQLPGLLGDIEHDRRGFEELEPIVVDRRDVAERIDADVVGTAELPAREIERTHAVGQPRFLDRPERAQIAGQADDGLRDVAKGVDGDHRVDFPVLVLAYGLRSTAAL
jgi:hypothetical protein